MFAVSRDGTIVHIGTVHAVAPGGFWVESDQRHPWLLGESAQGAYEDLPYFLDDIRPQGFLGRQIARSTAAQLGASENPERWGAEQIAEYLLGFGRDLPGNLLLGEKMAKAVERHEPDVVLRRDAAYPELAARAMLGGDPGSSAGGEHPKFSVSTVDHGAVIVKFSPEGEGEEVTRWRDLLIAEWHALETLGETGCSAVASRVYEIGNRVYLESTRFDREGERGRRPSVSLAGLDAEFLGECGNWSTAASGLVEAGLIEEADRGQMRWLDLFGAWIGNTDRHLGNMSLRPTPQGRFALHPAYDMLPMLYAPRRGEILDPALEGPRPSYTDPRGVWEDTGAWAARYWGRVAEDPRLSERFKGIAQTNHRLVEKRRACDREPDGDPAPDVF